EVPRRSTVVSVRNPPHPRRRRSPRARARAAPGPAGLTPSRSWVSTPPPASRTHGPRAKRPAVPRSPAPPVPTRAAPRAPPPIARIRELEERARRPRREPRFGAHDPARRIERVAPPERPGDERLGGRGARGVVRNRPTRGHDARGGRPVALEEDVAGALEHPAA